MKQDINIALKMQIVGRYRYQAQFAMAVAKSESYVSHIITGTRQLPHDEYPVWANALGLALDEFENIMCADPTELVRSTT